MTLRRPKQRSHSCTPTYPFSTKLQNCRVPPTVSVLTDLPYVSNNSNSSKLSKSSLIKCHSNGGGMQNRSSRPTDPCAQYSDCNGTHHCSIGKRNDALFGCNENKAPLRPKPWYPSNHRMYDLKTRSQKSCQENNTDSLHTSRYNKAPQFDANELKIYLKSCMSNRSTVAGSEQDDREMEERILNVLAASSGRSKIMDCLSQVQEKCLKEDDDLLQLITRLKHCAGDRFGASNQRCTKTPVPQGKQPPCLYCSVNPCRCRRDRQQLYQNPHIRIINADSSLRGGHDRYPDHSYLPVKVQEASDDQRPNYSSLTRTKHNRDYGQRVYRQPMKEWYDNNWRSSFHCRTTHQRDFPAADNRVYICPICHQQRWYKVDNYIFTKRQLIDEINSDSEDGPIVGLLPPRYRSSTRSVNSHGSDMNFTRQRYSNRY